MHTFQGSARHAGICPCRTSTVPGTRACGFYLETILLQKTAVIRSALDALFNMKQQITSTRHQVLRNMTIIFSDR